MLKIISYKIIPAFYLAQQDTSSALKLQIVINAIYHVHLVLVLMLINVHHAHLNHFSIIILALQLALLNSIQIQAIINVNPA